MKPPASPQERQRRGRGAKNGHAFALRTQQSRNPRELRRPVRPVHRVGNPQQGQIDEGGIAPPLAQSDFVVVKPFVVPVLHILPAVMVHVAGLDNDLPRLLAAPGPAR